MWVSFTELPLEYTKLVWKVAEQLGELMVERHDGGFDSLLRFCVDIDLDKGWATTVVGFSTAGGSATIPVTYESLEIQCDWCGNNQDATSSCPALFRRMPTRQLPPASHPVASASHTTR